MESDLRYVQDLVRGRFRMYLGLIWRQSDFDRGDVVLD